MHTVALEAGQALATASASLPQGHICFARCLSEKPSGEHDAKTYLSDNFGFFIKQWKVVFLQPILTASCMALCFQQDAYVHILALLETTASLL